MLHCKFCDYTSDRKYNLDRHYNKKHVEQLQEETNKILHEVVQDQDTQKEFYCQKCYKAYASNRYLLDHEAKCDGFDSLTCKTCMTRFSHRTSKYKHVKRGTCKPKSKIHYKNPNLENISNSHINSHNITTNNTNNTTNNNCNNTYNIIINDMYHERMDYITMDLFIKTLRSSNTIPNYIGIKHFHHDFPENHNIKFENNICYIRQNKKWQPISIDKLSSDLLQTNTHEIAKKYQNAKNIIENIIQNVDIIEYIENKFDYLDLVTNKNKYKTMINDIKCLIRANSYDELCKSTYKCGMTAL